MELGFERMFDALDLLPLNLTVCWCVRHFDMKSLSGILSLTHSPFSTTSRFPSSSHNSKTSPLYFYRSTLNFPYVNSHFLYLLHFVHHIL